MVSDWASLRLNACMLNPEFVKKVKCTENGAIYLKTLREQIIDDLKLGEAPDVYDFMERVQRET